MHAAYIRRYVLQNGEAHIAVTWQQKLNVLRLQYYSFHR